MVSHPDGKFKGKLQNPADFSAGHLAAGCRRYIFGYGLPQPFGLRNDRLGRKRCLPKSYQIGGLRALTVRQITARIPHPSSKLPWVWGNFEATFPPGEGTRLRR